MEQELFLSEYLFLYRSNGIKVFICKAHSFMEAFDQFEKLTGESVTTVLQAMRNVQ